MRQRKGRSWSSGLGFAAKLADRRGQVVAGLRVQKHQDGGEIRRNLNEDGDLPGWCVNSGCRFMPESWGGRSCRIFATSPAAVSISAMAPASAGARRGRNPSAAKARWSAIAGLSFRQLKGLVGRQVHSTKPILFNFASVSRNCCKPSLK
jgi:hypothetical protein